MFEVLLKEYFAIYKNYEICYNLFFVSFNEDQMNVHNNFLNYVQALESLHAILFSNKKELNETEFKIFLEKIRSINFSEKEIKFLDLDHINEISLAKRLLQLIVTHKEIRKIFKNRDDIDSFTYKVIRTRNYYIHHDKSIELDIFDKEELYSVTKKLQIILHFYLLLIIGILPTQLEMAFRRDESYGPYFD